MQYFGFDRPSFGIKTFGFGESAPKLQANFTTGTYKADGETKTFADLFTFNRAGKAWLVKDTGLQEYAADVPRLDDGLLIEQSATNGFKNNATYGDSGDSDRTSKEITIGGYLGSEIKITSTASYSGYAQINNGALIGKLDKGCYKSIYIKKGFSRYFSLSNAFGNPTTAVDTVDGVIYSSGDYFSELIDLGTGWLRLTVMTIDVAKNTWLATQGGGIENALKIITTTGEVGVYAFPMMMDSTAISCTPIITNDTPVTRPADYLTNKITGTTVTGDWDSTLTLSIVAGKLVHSGYGRIRSLEIN